VTRNGGRDNTRRRAPRCWRGIRSGGQNPCCHGASGVKVLADAGYFSEDNLAAVASYGADPYIVP
jgi:hypothetical protein